MTYADHGFQSMADMLAARQAGLTEPVMAAGGKRRNRTIAADKTPLPTPAAQKHPAAPSTPTPTPVAAAARATGPKHHQPSPESQQAAKDAEVYNKLYGKPEEPTPSAQEARLYNAVYSQPEPPSTGTEDDKSNYAKVYPSAPAA